MTHDAPKIALFGGTFDPIHEGHLEIVTRAQQEINLDQVIFLPCRRSPHKETGPIASDQKRLEMLQRAIANLPWAEVSDFEFHRPAPSYTWQTIEALKPNLAKNTKLFLIIGLDQWEALPRWKNPEKLAASVTFLVFGRNGEPAPREGYHAHFFKSDHPASSSEIRQILASKKPHIWLPAAVSDYIAKKHLYSRIR